MEEHKRHHEELQARIEAYEGCEGFKLRNELRAFRTGYDIFLGNYGELTRTLASAQDPQAWPYLWDPKHRDRVVRFNREIARVLHNYVTSVKYKGTEFLKEYQDRIDRDFKEDPLSQFLEDLRNYVLHKNIFAASLTLKGDNQGYISGSHVALDVAGLREWKRLSPEARAYLDTLPDEARLEDAINAYKTKVTKFWTWLGARLGQEHTETFKEMAILEDRIGDVDPNWESGYGETYTAKGRSS